MNRIRSFALNHPVIFVVNVRIAWFVLLMVFMGFASSALGKPYGDPTTIPMGHIATTACILLLVWHLDWSKTAGITRLGRWQIWLIALAGLIYFASASLYSFYGRITLDFPNLHASSTTILANHAVCLSEEILFRGLVLYALIHAWRHTKRGIIGSVLFSSLLFAALHITQVLTGGISRSSILLLTLETYIISIWWSTLVLLSKSIWPAMILHFAVNAVVAIQGFSVSMIEPDILVYSRILWFSIPLGILSIGLLVRAAPQLIASELS